VVKPATSRAGDVAELIDDVRDGLMKERAAGRSPTTATLSRPMYDAVMRCKAREAAHSITPVLLGLTVYASDGLRPGEIVFR
jgi:hypothetical protein